MYQKDKSESYLMINCLSGTMSLGANLLSIFVPSYFLTVTKQNNTMYKTKKCPYIYANAYTYRINIQTFLFTVDIRRMFY